VPSYVECAIVEGNGLKDLLPQLSDIGRIPKHSRAQFYFKIWLIVDTKDNEARGLYGDLHVLIYGIESLDDRGEKWLVSGEARREDVRIGAHWQNLLLPPGNTLAFEATYDTRLRSGQLKLTRRNL
jgi:hypothetical protein